MLATRFENSFRLASLYFIVTLFVCVSSSIAKAKDSGFRYIKCQDDSILTCYALQDSLPSELITYLNKGVPISFDYNIELWRERSGWFDKQVDKIAVSYRVRYDPWEKEYLVVQTDGNLTIDNTLKGQRETIDLVKSSGVNSLSFDDSSGIYYLVGNLTIKTMSFSNYREVEAWLRGDISDAKRPDLQEAPSKFGEFIFDMALKISGLKNISQDSKTQKFKISQLPLVFR